MKHFQPPGTLANLPRGRRIELRFATLQKHDQRDWQRRIESVISPCASLPTVHCNMCNCIPASEGSKALTKHNDLTRLLQSIEATRTSPSQHNTSTSSRRSLGGLPAPNGQPSGRQEKRAACQFNRYKAFPSFLFLLCPSFFFSPVETESSTNRQLVTGFDFIGIH